MKYLLLEFRLWRYTMIEKVISWIVWHLPKRIYLMTVVRGFAEATSGKWGNRHPLEVNYKDVYDAIVEKYNIKE